MGSPSELDALLRFKRDVVLATTVPFATEDDLLTLNCWAASS
jgi:hypothetical protein